jgi:fermentation-respiration switch protein FrsA (DUF1100 family)
MRAFTTRLAALAAAASLGACTNLFLQPDRVLHLRPENVGARYETVDFRSADGTKLCGLWFPARRATTKGVVVQFHGNGENETSHFLYVYWLALEGWDVFAFDYRGYGASGGEKSMAGAVADGAAALAYARSRASGKPLVVIGQSLGGELALAALERDGGDGLRALVLDSTFASNRDVAQGKLAQLWLTWPLQWPLSRLLISDRWAARRFIARRRPAPLLMMHAEGDTVVPYADGRALYLLATGPKEFWDIPGAGHLLALGTDGAEFRPKLSAWLDAAVGVH